MYSSDIEVQPEEYVADETKIADHFEKYYGNVVMVNLLSGIRPITGRLIEIDDVWIAIQKRDGYTVDIKKKAVGAIGEVRPLPAQETEQAERPDTFEEFQHRNGYIQRT